MKNKRPTLITILCIIGFIGFPIQVLSSIFHFLPKVSGFTITSPSIWYSIFNIVMAFLFLIGFIGIWKMKKWGLIFYTISLIVNYIVLISLGFAVYISLIIEVIVLGLFYTKFNLMN